MEVKIVVKVAMHSEKDQSKAMQIAVGEEGVSSVSIKRESDEVVVIGEGVDSVTLAISLRKKFSFADIVSVEEVKPPKPDDPCPLPPACSYLPPPFTYFSPPNCSLDFPYYWPS